jgi:hypothetical protein
MAGQRVIVNEPVRIADIRQPCIGVRSSTNGQLLPRQKIGRLGELWRSGMACVWDDVRHRDSVPGDDESLTGLDPVEYLGVVVPQLSLGNDG